MQKRLAITGAAAGLGRVIADLALSRGRSVMLIDRDGDQAHHAASELRDHHDGEVDVLVADLGTIDGVHAAADQLIEHHLVDALVNNAGGWLPGEQYPEAEPERWLSAMTLNLLAPMLLTQRLWPMLSSGSGAVVNVGSSGGVGDAGYGSPEYGAAKAGLRRFTAGLGSCSDVRVMAVVPGWIGLERAHREYAALTSEEQRAAGPLIPPADIAAAVLDLLEHGRPGQVVEMLGLDDLPGHPD